MPRVLKDKLAWLIFGFDTFIVRLAMVEKS